MSKSTITIAVILGTNREQRESIKAARYVAEFGSKLEDVEMLFADPKDFYFAGDGNTDDARDGRYTAIVEKADAFFIVTPEYNHSFPGSLKRMLDSEYGAYLHKPVALAGVSNGPWGGVRVCEALLPVCHRLGLVNILPEVYFPKIQTLFNEDGSLKSEHEALYTQSVGKAFDELLWFARLVRDAR